MAKIALEQIERLILELCTKRGPEKTICPSEVARALVSQDEEWRPHMDKVRSAGRKLMRDGLIVVSQRGVPIDPDQSKGPIRFGLANKSSVSRT